MVKNTSNTARNKSVLCLKNLKNSYVSRRNVGVKPKNLSSDLYRTVLYILLAYRLTCSSN